MIDDMETKRKKGEGEEKKEVFVKKKKKIQEYKWLVVK